MSAGSDHPGWRNGHKGAPGERAEIWHLGSDPQATGTEDAAMGPSGAHCQDNVIKTTFGVQRTTGPSAGQLQVHHWLRRRVFTGTRSSNLELR